MKRSLPILALVLALLLTACGGSSAAPGRFTGSWYGWWSITDADGAYTSLNNTWYDACAVFTAGTGRHENDVSVLLWDEIGSRTEPMADMILKVPQADKAVVKKGRLLSSSFKPKGLSFVVDNDPLDNCLHMTASYKDKDGSFEITILLRPWGTQWGDAEDTCPELIPWGYYDRYIPLLNAGTVSPPEYIR